MTHVRPPVIYGQPLPDTRVPSVYRRVSDGYAPVSRSSAYQPLETNGQDPTSRSTAAIDGCAPVSRPLASHVSVLHSIDSMSQPDTSREPSRMQLLPAAATKMSYRPRNPDLAEAECRLVDFKEDYTPLEKQLLFGMIARMGNGETTRLFSILNWFVVQYGNTSCLDIVDGDGVSLFHHSIMCRRYHIASQLASLGANLDTQTFGQGRTPLHSAFMTGELRYVKLILDAGVKPRADKYGFMPNHL